MKTYYVKKRGDPNGKEHIFKAQDKNDLKEKMIKKLPYGRYTIKDGNGKALTGLTLNSYSRPQLPKEEYDNLYFYVTENGQALIEKGRKPATVSSPRRYNSIEEVRKSALAKSYANYRLIKDGYTFSDKTVIFYIYKGTKLLGQVYCSPLAKAPYKGTGKWIEYVRHTDSPFMSSNSYILFKDGSIKKE